uniref:Disease resistance R13L4/SHOC-2-like LRR domain-containing protein n=1 Tax=Chenopodium quinoa TaxID=63459 RepID=A0A803LU81_CHEQI
MEAFRLLKVLDLQEAPIIFLPENIGDLFHLRYPSVRHTKTKELPKSIGKLHNLQTLDVKCSFVHELPDEVKYLINLLYLLGYNYDYETDFSVSAQKGLKLKHGLGRLQNLQKLYLVEASDGMTLFRDFDEPPESLEVCSEEDGMLDLQFISSPPQYLQRIYLKGRLAKVPDWIPKLKYLATVSLMWSGLMTDPVNILQDLTHLSELVLQDSFLGEELVFQATGFQKLKILKLYDMNTLTKLTIEKGALPLLELFKIGPIPRLNTVPEGIYHLRSLSALRFYDVSKVFVHKLLPDEGQDFWIIEHVKTVLFHYQIKGERYKSCTLNDLIFLNH